MRTKRLDRTTGLAIGLLVTGIVSTAVAVLPGNSATATRPVDSTAANSGDFATDAFGDPWDFDNPEDLDPATQYLSVEAANIRLARSGNASVLAATMTGPGAITLADSGPTVMPWGRNLRLSPIDAGRYTQLRVRMYSSRDMAAGVQYMSCVDNTAACFNGAPFAVQAGWHDYALDLRSAAPYFADKPRWGGQVMMLRLAFSPGAATDIELDSVRLTSEGAPAPAAGVRPQPQVLSPAFSAGADYATWPKAVRGT